MTTENIYERPPAQLWAATCSFCALLGDMRPGAGRITLYSHGVVSLEFFCVHCHEYNRTPIHAGLAEALTDIGVPTDVVAVPAEMYEHPLEGAARPIATIECAHLERYSLDLFQRLAIKEFGL